MIANIIDSLVQFVSNIIGTTGYPGIIILMAIESACIPLPSEIIMPFSGFLVSTGKLNLHAVAFAGAFGNLLGSIVAYVVGYFGGRSFVLRYKKYIFLREHELRIAEKFFEKWGGATVFFTRMMPIVRTYISLPAGLAKMNFPSFCILTFVGSIPWAYLLTYAGLILGENWREIKRYTELIDILVILAILGVIIYLIVRKKRKRESMN